MDVNKCSCQVRTEVAYGFGSGLLGSSLLAGVGLRSRSFLGGGSLGGSLLCSGCLLCGGLGRLGGLLGFSRGFLLLGSLLSSSWLSGSLRELHWARRTYASQC